MGLFEVLLLFVVFIVFLFVLFFVDRQFHY